MTPSTNNIRGSVGRGKPVDDIGVPVLRSEFKGRGSTRSRRARGRIGREELVDDGGVPILSREVQGREATNGGRVHRGIGRSALLNDSGLTVLFFQLQARPLVRFGCSGDRREELVNGGGMPILRREM